MNAEQEIARLRLALGALVRRLDEVHAHPQYQSVWQLYMIHGGDYSKGPKYEAELNVARAALSPESAPPTTNPVCPDCGDGFSWFCVSCGGDLRHEQTYICCDDGACPDSGHRKGWCVRCCHCAPRIPSSGESAPPELTQSERERVIKALEPLKTAFDTWNAPSNPEIWDGCLMAITPDHGRFAADVYASLRTPPTGDTANSAIDFENGRIRRRENAKLIDNPYPKETQGAIDWERGWKVEHYAILREEVPPTGDTTQCCWNCTRITHGCQYCGKKRSEEPPMSTNAPVWFVECVFNGKFEGWWTQPPKGTGGWMTTDPNAAKRYTRAEAEAVAAALSYFPTPFRWSAWVPTEHVFLPTGDTSTPGEPQEFRDCDTCGSRVPPGGVNAQGILRVIDALRAELARERERFNKLEGEWIAARNKLNQRVGDLRERAEAAERELAAARDKCAELARERENNADWKRYTGCATPEEYADVSERRTVAALNEFAERRCVELAAARESLAQREAEVVQACGKLYDSTQFGEMRCYLPAGHLMHKSKGGAEWRDSSCK